MRKDKSTILIKVTSVLSKRIRLTYTQWKHITEKHREVDSQLKLIQETLVDPEFVLYSPSEENFQYYRFQKDSPVTDKYLLVVVKHLNQEGFIITAFFVRKVKLREKEVVYGEENLYKL